VLARHPDHIDNTVLAQFPEFQEFLSRAKTTASPPGEGGGGLAEPQATPEEAIDAAYRELRAALAEEVLGRVLNKPASSLRPWSWTCCWMTPLRPIGGSPRSTTS
jgi:restriction system protein